MERLRNLISVGSVGNFHILRLAHFDKNQEYANETISKRETQINFKLTFISSHAFFIPQVASILSNQFKSRFGQAHTSSSLNFFAMF